MGRGRSVRSAPSCLPKRLTSCNAAFSVSGSRCASLVTTTATLLCTMNMIQSSCILPRQDPKYLTYCTDYSTRAEEEEEEERKVLSTCLVQKYRGPVVIIERR